MNLKFLLTILCGFLFFGCQQKSDNNTFDHLSENENHSKLPDPYVPGTDVMMNTIQSHHAKLWFAGMNENWELAAYQIHELEENFEDIEVYKADKDHTKYLPMIYPPIDSVLQAILDKNPSRFELSYSDLTNSCNSCHAITGHEYIQIKTPDKNTFVNQSFEIKK